VNNLSGFSARSIHGSDIDLASYGGQVVLVVNTASKCGLTPQFEGLQQLYDKFASDGFSVLGFPCDQFANQDPGSDEEIASFCQRNYGVSFPMFSKIDVNGDDAHPLFRWLRAESRLQGRPITWNFAKFLIGRDGTLIRCYKPDVEPEDLVEDIAEALAQPV